MLVLFEITKDKPLLKPFSFKGRVGKGTVRRYGYLWFGVSIITAHDYFSYHEYVESGAGKRYDS